MSIFGAFLYFMDGSPHGNFTSTRGLRQGDPLSPFLFILGAEALSRLIALEESKGNLHGICISRNSPSISHLAYADDLYFFLKLRLMKQLPFFIVSRNMKVGLDRWLISPNLLSSSARIPRILSLLLFSLFSIFKQIPPHAKYLGLPLVLS
jgi:hypothetical protein